jgi:hypothetical protein
MNNPIEFHGAFLVRAELATWTFIESFLSRDAERLAEIFEVAHSGFRVQRLKKVAGAPQWIGLWWTEAEPSSITGSLDDAQYLAREFALAGDCNGLSRAADPFEY